MSHSVQEHLRVSAAEYDREIRTMVPDYDALTEELLAWLSPIAERGAHVVDLGCGTGALAEAVAERFPGVTLEGWDVDPRMLGRAAERLARFGDRVKLRERSFFEELPPCDAVVASLSLHHVPSLDDKSRLYASIFRALRPGGIFLDADVTMSTSPEVKRRTFERWARFMATQGISEADAYRHFEAWRGEDTYFPLHAELAALEKAGFDPPECFWRRGPMTLYGGAKR